MDQLLQMNDQWHMLTGMPGESIWVLFAAVVLSSIPQVPETLAVLSAVGLLEASSMSS